MFHHRPHLTWCAAAAVILVGALGPTPEARAYRQTKTCIYADERDPKAPTLIPDCLSGEKSWPVSWPTRRIAYKINGAGTETFGGNPPELTAAMRAGIEVWNAQSCSDFEFVYEGTTTIAGHNPTDRVNVVAFLDDNWPDTSDAIALTTTTMTARGELLDVDVELNSQVHTFSITDTNVMADVENTLAHEAGHMLGLDHTSEAEATMYYEAPDREIKKRDLHPDDIAGLCTVYPTDVPETVYTDELDEGGCCATTPAGNAPAKHHWLLGFALMLFWRSRNPRRAKTPRSPARLG